MGKLDGKVAIVTGGGSGIGRAIALLYAAEGAKVMVSDIDEKGSMAVVGEIRAGGGEASFFWTDTSSATDSEALVNATMRDYGALHIAVNNAGIGGPLVPLGEYPIEGWNHVIGVNLSGVFYGMRFQIPAMLTSGGGSIVNVASILGQVGTKKAAAYVAAKHGVVGLTKVAALDYATQNIRVNAIGPGYILTPMLTSNLDSDMMNAVASLHPMGHLGKPEEVANLSLWLNSSDASFVTGAYYQVDGGYLAQ